MVRSSEPMVSLGDPVAANIEGKYLLDRSLVGCHVVDKNFTFSLNIIRPPSERLKRVLVPMVPPFEPVVLDSDRVQVVFPEPRTPSTLTIRAALAVAQASARPISVTS